MTGQADLKQLDRMVAAWMEELPGEQVVRVSAETDPATVAHHVAARLGDGS